VSCAEPTQNTIRIDAADDQGQVVLTPEDQDRFVLSCRDTVRCASIGLGWNAISDEIDAIVRHVAEWAKSQHGVVEHCYVGIREGHLVVLVMPVGGSLRPDLASTLTELDIAIAEKFQACPCDVLQIPGSSLDDLSTIAYPQGLAHVYGKRRSPEQVAQ